MVTARQLRDWAQDMLIPHVGNVREDERLLFIKSNSNDVFCIFKGKSVCLFYGKVLPEELFIVGQLDHKGDIKHILQVPWHQECSSGSECSSG